MSCEISSGTELIKNFLEDTSNGSTAICASVLQTDMEKEQIAMQMLSQKEEDYLKGLLKGYYLKGCIEIFSYFIT